MARSRDLQTCADLRSSWGDSIEGTSVQRFKRKRENDRAQSLIFGALVIKF